MKANSKRKKHIFIPLSRILKDKEIHTWKNSILANQLLIADDLIFMKWVCLK
jgi:hypothetical protein